MKSDVIILVARQIVTMNPSNPVGTAVAVRDGRILGVGTLEELEGWGAYELDDTFHVKVLVPGFIEAHGHIGEGGLWASAPYLGYYDRTAPSGTHVPGAKSVAAVIERLKELEAQMDDPDAPLLAWGFDPIYFPKGTRFYAVELDQVSASRPIFILHMSGHVATVNSALMQKEGITADLDIEGLVKGDDGQPLGELQTHAVMALAKEAFVKLLSNVRSAKAIKNFGKLASRAGHTTATELGTVPVHDAEQFTLWHRVVDDPDYPVRVIPYFGPGSFGAPVNPADVIPVIRAAQAQDTDKLRIGGIKIWVDGSIQGFTARILWPEYYNGIDNGLWYVPPEKLKEFIKAYHQEGLNCHIHTNGAQATELLIDAVDEALREFAWLDHRHAAQHVQLSTPAQLRRMRTLGMCANFFVNHVYYYGDQHYEVILGPERANQINPCGTAKREGVSFSFHSDSPVSPIGHLHTMWCAVNRLTPKGRVLGEHEKISAYDALYAATVDAAYQIHMDHEIGSIEIGKRADFAVLDESPLDVEPIAIKDIPVWGTVLGGVKFPV